MQKNIFRSQCYNVKYGLHQQNGSKRQEKTITRKGYQKYKKFIKERQISKIIKKGTLQESYKKWTEEIKDVIQQVQKTVRKKPKERHKVAVEDKEESQDKDKKYKTFSKTYLNY